MKLKNNLLIFISAALFMCLIPVAFNAQAAYLSTQPGMLSSGSGQIVTVTPSWGTPATSNSQTGTYASPQGMNATGGAQTGTMMPQQMMPATGSTQTGTYASPQEMNATGGAQTGTMMPQQMMPATGGAQTGTMMPQQMMPTTGSAQTGTYASPLGMTATGGAQTGTMTPQQMMPATGSARTGNVTTLPGVSFPSSLSVFPSIPPAPAASMLPAGQWATPATVTEKEVVPSNIEKIINTVDKSLDEATPMPPLQMDITQFGYNFFEAGPGFSPLIDIPVGPDYVVGPGDTITMSIWGSLDGTWPLEVNRSGEIVLPKVGAVRVWGVSYAQLPQVIQNKLAGAFKNFHVNISMGKLRLIKVYIVGEVKSPGAYDVSSLSTLINALTAAGGPTKKGTLRNIKVKRGGKTVETVDLYDFFLKGDKSRDIRLQSGDTIYVPAVGKVAGIAGNVRRPAIYELNGEKTLKDLLTLADGIPPTGYQQRVQISRVTAHEKKGAADFNIDPKADKKSIDEQMESVTLQDMDIVKVFPIDTLLRDHVRLAGYILRPGDYALKSGMRVSDLLPRENLLPEYYGKVAEITRFSPPDLRPEKINFNLNKALAGDPGQNLELKEFDIVRIFSRWEMEELPSVTISGEVQRPGQYRIFEKMTLRDLIFAAGNVKKAAYLKNTEITRSVISKEGVKSSIINVDLDDALTGNSANNILLSDMDEVVVRRVPDWKEETERYATLSGEVNFPGVYPILKGEKLSSLIRRAGGYTDLAYLKGAKFTRKSVAEIQQKRMDEIITRSEQEVMRKQQELASVAASKEELEATKTSLAAMMASLDKLKQVKAEGRVSLKLGSVDELKGSPYDLVLQAGDSLSIPQSTNSIMVFGEVYNPTTVVQVPGEDVAYYLSKAGGTTT